MIKTLTDEQITVYEQKRMALMVPDPWSDPFCAKIGLCNMYIESTIAEILHLSAESEPGVKLNCPNPIYGKYHKLLESCLKSKGKGSESVSNFKELVQFLETKVMDNGRINIEKWTGQYTPDIRLVDTIDEAIGWLAWYLNIQTDI